ncbi:hypothetical protein P692DRAFT_201796911 [Suillus brevipes Sb2]|nr:hypothetical protein P692DRAFT_201796911 [Suillus brevipes Sb2]
MSVLGVLPNMKWPELVLTEASSGKVDGENFVGTSNQRWIGEFDYEEGTCRCIGTIQNENSGDYLAWDADMKVVMNGSKYWWKLVFGDGCVGFQVPEEKMASETSANATSCYTLELEDDQSVSGPLTVVPY